jgi:hypothetical protein
MRTEVFLRHLALLAVVALLAYPAAAWPGPSRLGKPDEVGTRPPADDRGDQGGAQPDPGHQTGENQGNGVNPDDGNADDDRDKRDTKREKVSVRRRVRLGLAAECRGRTRARARDSGRLASSRDLARNVLRRR